MKQYAGEDLPPIMAEMPAELVAVVQAEFAEHRITEREARWWGFLMFARSDCYEGTEVTIRRPDPTPSSRSSS